MPEAADVVRRSPSLRAAARTLGVNVSTLSRAVKTGALRRTNSPPAAATIPDEDQPHVEPTTFRAWALSTFEFTRDELELVEIAQAALDMAHDPAAHGNLRLAAMREYRAARRDLNLPAPEGDKHGEAETETRISTFPRRVG